MVVRICEHIISKMDNMMFHISISVFFLASTCRCQETSTFFAPDVELTDDVHLSKFLCGEYERVATKMCTATVKAEWDHLVDIKDKRKSEISINQTLLAAKFERENWKNIFTTLNPENIVDKGIERQLKKLSVLGNSALDDEKLTELTCILNDMMDIYSTAKICPYDQPKCDIRKAGLSYDPDIENIMARSHDYDELLYTWISWRDATGLRLRKRYEIYVSLVNEAARANNFSDKGEMWRHEFEMHNFEDEMEELWKDISPLYEELHEYVEHKLSKVYGKDMDEQDEDNIPAHLLGNMWGQSWLNLKKIMKPFPDVKDVDITCVLREKNFTVLKMFDTANEFYMSLGLSSMARAYDTKFGAVIEKPKNKSMLCHASAWDFCDGEDYRIKMCARVNHQDFITIHHELGHIQYYMQYRHLPITFRSGANPGFHEAIGDTIALSVGTPTHLKKIGLISDFTDSDEANINILMNMALERIAFLPFGYLLDKWRWDVFAENVEPDNWNDHYWKLREQYQKIKPGWPRADDDLDAASKFHVPGDSQYISYFFAHILEFQLYKSFCELCGQFDLKDNKRALHKCDIHNCVKAGDKLRDGLKLGSSKHWTHVLEKMTGHNKLSANAIREYFKPLYAYLRNANNLYELNRV